MTDADPRVAAVKEQLEAGTPPAWLWDEHGQRVIGEVIGGFLGNTKFATGIPVLTIKVLDGDNAGALASVWGTGILGDRLRRLNLVPGDVIGIERTGKETSAGGNEYWNYNVARYGTGTSGALGWDEPAALEAAKVVDAEVTDYNDDGFYKDEGGF